MHDDCWRELLLAEHDGHYLRVSVPRMTEGELRQWLAKVKPDEKINVNEIEDGVRWSYGEAFYESGERYSAPKYEFPDPYYPVWFTYMAKVMFVWFKDRQLALMFKLTFGGKTGE